MGLIKTKVNSGRYTSTSEVVREALRLLERSDDRETETLGYYRQAWVEGIASGAAGPVDFVELKKEARRKLASLTKK